MPQVSQSIEIDATPQECFDVVFDFKTYPEYLKETKAVVIEKKSGYAAEVTFTLEVIKKISYTIKMVGKPPKKLSWTLLKADLMKENKGSWTFEAIKSGGTKATYDVEVEFGLFVPGMIAKMLIGNSLPGMLKAVKQRVESLK